MAKKPRRHEEEDHPDETWLVPYSDVLTLLLALFIVLFAMSKVDQEKFQQLSETFRRTFVEGGAGILSGNRSITPELVTPPPPAGDQSGVSVQDMNAALNNYIQLNSMQDLVSIIRTPSGFSVRILDSVMFSPGSAMLIPTAQNLLNEIAQQAVKSSYYINIEGHTDDTATPTVNWQLSTGRALEVLKFMSAHDVLPDRLSATGYGQYHPLLPNITPENRSLNRRVEINFVSPDFFLSNKKILNKATND